jgi:integrase
LQSFEIKAIIIENLKEETMIFTGRPNTIRTKESMFRNWVEPNLADDGSNLDEAVAIWETDLQPGSIKTLLYIAKEYVKAETGKDLDIKSHVKRVGRSKQQTPTKALTQPEIVALSAVIEADDPLYLPYHIAINTGMRRGEVFGLRWEDVDMMKNRIIVQRSNSGPTKSGKSRYIPISSALEKVLVAETFGKSYNKSKGKRSGSMIKSLFDPNPHLRAACKEAGVREINFHGLRHTFATLALEAGRSPVLVSKCLGHAATSTTLDLYWNVTGESLDMTFLEEIKEAAAEARKEWREQNPEKVQKNKVAGRAVYKERKENKERILDYLIERYGDTPCMDCGGEFEWCSMDFDHRPGETKELKIGSVGGAKATLQYIARVEKEIAKCDLVCANCHRVRTKDRHA